MNKQIKNLKRATAILLCLCMLCGTVVLFASCGGKTAKVDLSGYRIVYEKGFNATLLSCVKDLESNVKDVLGARLEKTTASDTDPVELEILIGETGRAETEALKKKIKGEGYAYGVRKGKVVIIGTGKLYTLMALEAFAAAYTATGNGTTLSIRETVSSNMNTVFLSEQYGIAYSANLDEAAQKGEGNVNAKENPDCLSYEVVAATALRAKLRGILSAKSTSLPYNNDKKSTYEKEVLLGYVSRDAAKSFAKQMDADRYGISVTADKVMALGLNEKTMRAAVTALNDIIDAAVVEIDGEKRIALPEGFSLVKSVSASKWVLDFPRPTGENIVLEGTVDAESNHVLFMYGGAGVNENAYKSYCEQLVAAGYELLQERETGGSYYRTYRNGQKNIRLQVTYASYSYAESQNLKDYTPCIRIVSAKEDERGTDFDDKYLHQDLSSYTKCTNTRVTAVYLNYHLKNDNSIYGNCYVVQLEDGSFIVQDGGHNNGGAENRLYSVLSDLHRQATGTSPSAANPIVVAGWYLTHGHGDHYPTFTAMCKKYGQSIRVETIISNFPSDEMFYSWPKANMTIRNDMSVVTGYTQGEMQYIKVHSGQTVYLRNVEIEILYTPEDLYPTPPEQYNDTCTVARFIVHTTDGNGHKQGKPTSILWMGDAQPDTTRCMRAMWGETLKSDAVQVAHHGGGDSERYFYPVVQPEVVFWPCAASQMSGRVNDKSNTNSWKYSIYNLYRMDSVKYHVVSDLYNTTITITGEGFHMNLTGEHALYNAGESTAIVIGGPTDHDCSVIQK